jgi:hypothetical protein
VITFIFQQECQIDLPSSSAFTLITLIIILHHLGQVILTFACPAWHRHPDTRNFSLATHSKDEAIEVK